MGKSDNFYKSLPQARATEDGADPPTPRLPGPLSQRGSTFKQNEGVLIRAEGGIAFHLTK